MKAIFEFQLPEDQREYEIMNQAYKMKQALWYINEALRSWDKYGHTFTSADDAIDKIREEFYRSLNEHQVNIDL